MSCLVSISTLIGLSFSSPNTPLPSSAQIQCIVVDLGGVVVDTNPKGSKAEIGFGTMISYWFKNGGNPKKIKSRFYDILNEVDTSVYEEVYDEHGLQLPSLMIEWLLGIRKNEHIKEQILTAFQNPELFKNKQEQAFFTKLAVMIFTTESFINSRMINYETISFLKECKKQGYKLVVLSNWDAESFELMVKNNQEVFDIFDDIVISGKVQAIKPSPTIYSYVTRSYHANTCVLLDDQIENIKTAQDIGMHTIHVPRKKKIGSPANIDTVREQFNEILSKQALNYA